VRLVARLLLASTFVFAVSFAAPGVARAQAEEEEEDDEWELDDDWMEDESGGDESGGDESGGDESGGDESGGDESGGDETGGDESAGDETGGDESGGDESGGDETGGDESGGDESGGEETRGDETPGGGAAPEPPASGAADPAGPDRERTPPGTYRAMWAEHEADAEEPGPVYTADDPQLRMKQGIERLLGIHVVHPPWRHVSEQVEISGSRVSVRYWYSIAQDASVVMCDALRWLSKGRNQWAEGVAGVFEEYEDVEQVTLYFINVERRRKGQVPGARDYRPYLTATVVRDGLDALSAAEVEEVFSSGGSCADYLRKHLKRFDFRSHYYERELRRGVEGR